MKANVMQASDLEWHPDMTGIHLNWITCFNPAFCSMIVPGEHIALYLAYFIKQLHGLVFSFYVNKSSDIAYIRLLLII